MNKHTITSHDGHQLTYAVSENTPGKPWIALIIPFGLKVEATSHFFDFFAPHYNIITWETRSILEDSDRKVAENEFTIENHLFDLKTILETVPTEQFIMVGYCSGAGIALGAANRYPNLIGDLILLHGEYTMLHNSDYTAQFAAEMDSLLTLASKGENYLDRIFEKISVERLETPPNLPDDIDLPFTRKSYLRRHSANYLNYKSVDYEALAKYTTHKTLVMAGERDVQSNVASSKRICELLPNAQIHIDPQADHYEILRENSASMVTIWNYLYNQKQQAA